MDSSVGSLDRPESMKPVNHFAVAYRIAAFHTSDGLPEEFIDSNKKINARWTRAYADGTPIGSQRKYKKIK